VAGEDLELVAPVDRGGEVLVPVGDGVDPFGRSVRVVLERSGLVEADDEPVEVSALVADAFVFVSGDPDDVRASCAQCVDGGLADRDRGPGLEPGAFGIEPGEPSEDPDEPVLDGVVVLLVGDAHAPDDGVRDAGGVPGEFFACVVVAEVGLAGEVLEVGVGHTRGGIGRP